MARRSSARLRAKVSTPQTQRVSDMGVDGMTKTPLTAPKLSSLQEDDETPARRAETPRDGTPIKPNPEEMHPQKYQMSTAKPLDEARWLGFSSTKATQQTPTKTPRAAPKNIMDNAPNFDFTFRRPELQLSPLARAIMVEKKEEASKIREQMEATQHGQASASDVLGRKLATPMAKVGRFSDVHMQAFKKMDSIANHASAFRAEKNEKTKPQPTTSLKRSPSKAELEHSSTSKPLPRPTSRGNLDAPAKRVKRGAADDAATTRPTTPKDDKSASRIVKLPPSLKSHKSARRTTMIPSLPRSSAKIGMTSASLQQPPSLLSKSPIKSPVKMSSAMPETMPGTPESPLLSRSPVKSHAPLDVQAHESPDAASASAKIPFLARSPSKMSVADHVASIDGNKTAPTHKADKSRLLSRSPSKIAIPDKFDQTPAKPSLMTRFNLLRQSPIKSILRTPQRQYSDDPFKVATGTHLSTPPNQDKPVPRQPPKTCPVMKHVDFSASTKALDNFDKAPGTPSKAPTPHSKAPVPPPKDIKAPTPPRKDTKAPTPPPKDTKPDESAITYPKLPTIDAPEATESAEARAIKKARRTTMAVPSDFTFRSEVGISFAPPSPRRVTSNEVKPSIRHVSAESDFVASKKRKISDVAEETATTQKGNTASDKENDDTDARPAKKARPNTPSEEQQHQHQQKSSRPSVAAPAKTPRKVPTLGVKPKSTQKPKEKRSGGGMLSQSRLAMLATPKRR